MKNVTRLFTILSLSAILFTSCKKDDDPNNNTAINVDAGRAAILFNSNANFGGSTNYDSRNETTSTAISEINSGLRSIILTTISISGTTSRTARIDMLMPETTTTSSGNITVDLSSLSSPVIADISLVSVTGGSIGPTYEVTGGTMTITSLNNNEVRGTFAATVEDGGSTVLTLTNGVFVGRFQ